MFGQEGWIIALLTFFMDLHFVSIHSNAEKIFSRRIYSHLHLTLGQEWMFICIYEWQVKFFLQFLAAGFIYQTTRILFLKMNCLFLNIVLILCGCHSLIFIFPEWIYIIIQSDKSSFKFQIIILVSNLFIILSDGSSFKFQIIILVSNLFIILSDGSSFKFQIIILVSNLFIILSDGSSFKGE